MLAVHFVDLDHFKHVNDTQGHHAGDKLLSIVADRLRSLRRRTDTIARMGGDEFALVQVGVTEASDAAALAHRMIEVLSEPYELEGRKVIIGASVGIATATSNHAGPDVLMRNADLALYHAKGKGRGTHHFFEAAMEVEMRARHELESDLRKGVGTDEFELNYQPTLNLATNKITGFEALVRWRHPTKGLILPAAFIPLAEETGAILPLGEWVLREACSEAARWPQELRLAVNLSPVQFRSAGLMTAIFDALGASGLAPDRLELEITETSLLQDTDATLGILYRLRDLGVRIALDDFGTGYSSLSYLQNFPFDRIKIDRCFVKDLAEDTGSLNIVRAVIGIAKGMRMETTAEGVESTEQLDILRSEGCTEMQGFLLSKPRVARDIEFVPLLTGIAQEDEAKAA